MKKNLYQMTQGAEEATEAYVLRKQKTIGKIQKLMGSSNREKTIDCLYFPSRENIVFFLQNHSLTQEITDKKIIHALAGFFADTKKAPLGVDLGVALCFDNLNANLSFDTMTLKLMQISLTCALKDCALTSEHCRRTGLSKEEISNLQMEKND